MIRHNAERLLTTLAPPVPAGLVSTVTTRWKGNVETPPPS